jgi:hypothetical protein
VNARKQVRNRLEADYLTRRPVDHTAPLPPAVIEPVVFEDELMAHLAEDGGAR